jgi:hypothetical protein
MADDQSPEYGTLIISALLLLALAFAGCWIFYYARFGAAPWGLLPWFGAAGVVIIVLGLLNYFRGGSGQ